MLFFPIGDENPSERTPVVTWVIIGLNVLVFLATTEHLSLPDHIARKWGYVPDNGAWYTFFTSMFLHGNLIHLLGNMWFLWIVGDNVEDALGHVAYLGFYLLSGVAAVGFYLLFTALGAGNVPLVGASGAISGVLGCYMLFFPSARIRIFYWVFFFLIGVAAVRAVWVIGAWIALQLFEWAAASRQQAVGGVAYAAHVGGFLVGIGVALLLKEHLRKAGRLTRRATAEGRHGRDRPVARPVGPAFPSPVFENPRVQRERDAEDFFGREEAIAENVKSGLLDVAVERYREYTRMPHAKPIPAWAQIEIAGELFRQKDYEGALEAYRRYLSNFPGGPDAPEAKFRLGVILARHRREFYRAREYLVQAAMEHPDPQIQTFAKQEMERIQAYL